MVGCEKDMVLSVFVAGNSVFTYKVRFPRFYHVLSCYRLGSALPKTSNLTKILPLPQSSPKYPETSRKALPKLDRRAAVGLERVVSSRKAATYLGERWGNGRTLVKPEVLGGAFFRPIAHLTLLCGWPRSTLSPPGKAG